MTLISNKFSQNSARENGLVLYISNCAGSLNIQSNSFVNNRYSILISTQNSGSVMYLSNPGNVSINFSNFENNYANFGTCIYYSENSNINKLIN